jgi:hypothetical protein
MRMKTPQVKAFFLLFLCSACHNFSNKPDNNKTPSENNAAQFNFDPKWLNTNKVFMAIDSTISFKGGFKCDSVEIIRYEGSFGEHSFPPLNKEGKWISTIKKRQRLTNQQVVFVSSILRTKATFKNPLIIGCFEPRIGLVYFRDNKVIGQAYLCLGCIRIESTVKLGNNEYYASFNQEARTKLGNFYDSLKIGK